MLIPHLGLNHWPL